MNNAFLRGSIARPPTAPATPEVPALAYRAARGEDRSPTIQRPFIALPLALGTPTMSLRILSAASLGLTSMLVAMTSMDSWRWKLTLAGIAAICWAHGLRTWLSSARERRSPGIGDRRQRAAYWVTTAIILAAAAGWWVTTPDSRRDSADAHAGGPSVRHAYSPSFRSRIVPVANHGNRPNAEPLHTPSNDAAATPPPSAPRAFAAPAAKRLAPKRLSTGSSPSRTSDSRTFPAMNALGTDGDSPSGSSVRQAAPGLNLLDEQLDMASEQRRLEEFMQVAYQEDASAGETKPSKPARPTPPATTDAETGGGAGTAPPMGSPPMTAAPMPPASSGTSTDGAAAGPAGSASATTIGVAPPKEQPEFLRQDSVLLEPGEYQLEFGLAYTLSNSTNTLSLQQGGAIFAGDVVRTNRLIISTIDVRLGITPDWQGSVVLPFGWSSGQLVFAGADEYSSTGGIGDINVSLTRLLQEGDMESATIMANFSCSAPTGQSNFASSVAVPGASLGQGFWTATAGITMVRVFDPLVLFGGFGYQHRFDTEIAPNVTLTPGVLASYRFGVGYAINSKITLNGSFSGAYLTEIHINNRRSAGSAREPLQLRLAMTIANREPNSPRNGKARTIEPYLTIGLTDVAPDVQMGIGWSY